MSCDNAESYASMSRLGRFYQSREQLRVKASPRKILRFSSISCSREQCTATELSKTRIGSSFLIEVLPIPSLTPSFSIFPAMLLRTLLHYIASTRKYFLLLPGKKFISLMTNERCRMKQQQRWVSCFERCTTSSTMKS